MTLPIDIWSEILQWLWLDRPRASELERFGRVHLRNAVLTCRTLYHAGIPYLYRHCQLGMMTRLDSFLNTLQTNRMAANSIRHLTVSIHEFLFPAASGQPFRGKGAPTLQWLASTLVRLPGLVSLYLNVWPRLGPPRDSQHLWDALVDVLFPNPVPFQLVLFHTNLPCTPSLLRFLSTQTGLIGISWRHPHLFHLTSTVQFPTTIRSMALTEFGFRQRAGAIFPPYLQATPFLEYLVLDIGEEGMFEEAVWPPPMGSRTILDQLKGLTVLLKGYQFLGPSIGVLLPWIRNVTWLSVRSFDPIKDARERLNSILTVNSCIRSIPRFDFLD